MKPIRRNLVWLLPLGVGTLAFTAWWWGGDQGVEASRKLPDPRDLRQVYADDGAPGKPEPGTEKPKYPPEWWAEYPARADLEQGEIVTQSETQGNLRINRAEGLIDAAPEDVFAVITDYEAYPEFMPDTVVGRIERRDGREYLVHQEVEVAFKRVRYDILIEHRADGLGTSWHQTGGDLEVNEGTWSIHQVGPSQSLAIYRLRLVPGFWIPQSIADRLLRRSLPGVIKAVRARATSRK